MRSFKLLLCLSFLLVATTLWAAPQLVVDEPTHDFGVIYQGQSVRHAFVFRNAGDQVLQIDRVRSSCGCTAALASAKTLNPGESGEIQATFDSTRFRGQITKTIYLTTNDATQPTTQLYIKGQIKEVVAVEPAQLNFGPLEVGATATLDVVLENHGDREYPLQDLQTTVPELQAQLLNDKLTPGQRATLRIKLTLKPGLPRFSGYVMVKVVGSAQPELRIPVYATAKL